MSVLKELDLTRNSRRYSAEHGKGWRQSNEYRHELPFPSFDTFYAKSDEVKMSPICFPFPFISFLDLWLNLTD